MTDGFTVNNFDHLAAASDVPYGLYDTVGNCWIGDISGPKVFTREDSLKANGMPTALLAQITAQVTEIQLGYAPGRVKAQEFNEQDLRLKDEVPIKMTSLEALRTLESGIAK